MCNRFAEEDPERIGQTVFDEFNIRWPNQKPRYNIAPSQLLMTVALAEGIPAAREMRWGLVPFWDRSEKPKITPTNAKSEEITAKPMFRQAVQKRRCLVPADGFYEWKKLDPEGKLKQPFHFHLLGKTPFFFAGIYETGAEGKPDSFAILTTSPNELMKPIHNRMPVILTKEYAKNWLTTTPVTGEEIARYCAPYPIDQMEAWPVSKIVSNPRNNVQECVVREETLL